MSERILTLFGEEIVPEQVKPAGRSRMKKKPAGEISEDTEETKELPATPTAERRARLKKEESAEEQGPVAAQLNTEMPDGQAAKEVAVRSAAEKSVDLPADWKGDKQYYSIGEVARLFNVKTSHIRFWTNEFKLKVRTTRKGDRLFTPGQVLELRTIHHLVKEKGYTLAGAKAKLRSQSKKNAEETGLKQSLRELRSTLMGIRDKLITG